MIVTGLAFAIVFVLPYLPDRRPSGVPWWLVALIVAFIGLPAFTMSGIAGRHALRANRARRREIVDGKVTYTNQVLRWVDYHGIGVAIAIVVTAVVLSVLLRKP